jgi:hypothetical protein
MAFSDAIYYRTDEGACESAHGQFAIRGEAESLGWRMARCIIQPDKAAYRIQQLLKEV